MKKIFISIILLVNFIFAAEVKELSWPTGESFLTFLDKYSISQKLYFDLEKEEKELCSEIRADNRYYLYENDDGTLNQVLIPVSQEIQLHVYENTKGEYKFQTLPINYQEYTETIVVPITSSVAYDLQQATSNPAISAMIKALFSDVNFRGMQKGDNVAIKYTQKVLMGKPHGLPEIQTAMIEVNKKRYYRFKNNDDDNYYNEKGVGFTKTYFFRVPLTYSRISSSFTRKRYHPVLKRYRAHLGTDFAAPRGRKIYAAANGRVSFVGRRGGYGKTIIIRHANGYKTLYAHQYKFNRSIKRGQRVRKGQHIGYVGSTGLSTGPHLHFGLYKNGRATNPMKVIKKPNVKGLKGKKKRTFIANAKLKIDELNYAINNENRPKPTKLARVAYKSDLVD
ncbi:MAG: peptidoglycan DD-metalloendopeptidase family protein [Campylobacterota bacterium]